MAKCIEKAEDHCKSYPRCYGCNAYREPTNADRIRAMSDEALNDLFRDIYNAGIDDAAEYEWGHRTNSFEWTIEWLQQPMEENDYA